MKKEMRKWNKLKCKLIFGRKYEFVECEKNERELFTLHQSFLTFAATLNLQRTLTSSALVKDNCDYCWTMSTHIEFAWAEWNHLNVDSAHSAMLIKMQIADYPTRGYFIPQLWNVWLSNWYRISSMLKPTQYSQLVKTINLLILHGNAVGYSFCLSNKTFGWRFVFVIRKCHWAPDIDLVIEKMFSLER